MNEMTGLLAQYGVALIFVNVLIDQAGIPVRITVDELRELLQWDRKRVMLDVRSATARKRDPRRDPGVIAVDIDAPERALPPVAPDREIVVYCT